MMRGNDQVRTAAAIAFVAIVTMLAGCAPVPAAAPATERADVTAVVDGDTIEVATASGSARVRLIGIDTPEIGRDGEPGDCYAEEARDFLDALLYGKTVELLGDPTQADVDRYGRMCSSTARAPPWPPWPPRTPTTRLTATLRALQRPRA